MRASSCTLLAPAAGTTRYRIVVSEHATIFGHYSYLIYACIKIHFSEAIHRSSRHRKPNSLNGDVKKMRERLYACHCRRASTTCVQCCLGVAYCWVLPAEDCS